MLNKFKSLTSVALITLSISCGSAPNSSNSTTTNQNINSQVNLQVVSTPVPEATIAPLPTATNSNTAATKNQPLTVKPPPSEIQPSRRPAPPTNNIPDAETLKRQMQKPTPTGNVSRDPSDGMMKRSNSNGGSMMRRSSNVNQ